MRTLSAVLRYVGDVSGFKLAGGIALTSRSDGSQSGTRRARLYCLGGSSDIDVTEVGLCGSILHTATALYATGAYGQLEDNNLDELYGRNVDDETKFFFIQAGIEKKFLPIGKTTIFGEYWQLDGGAGLEAGGTSSTFQASVPALAYQTLS